MNWDHLIEGCINNDRKSQEQLYRHFYPSMIAMCIRHCKDQEESILILNDGMLKVFKNISKYKKTGSFEGWVRRIVYNSISDYFRKKNRGLRFLALEDYDSPLQETVIQNLYEEDILNLLDLVPRASSEVFILFAIEGFTHKEIGQKKGISEGTSKWHYAEARKKLRKLIEKNYKQYKNG